MDAHSDGAALHQPTDYAAAFRRRWWVVGLFALLGLALAALVTLLLPTRYTSVVLVQVTPAGPSSTAPATNGRTQGVVNLDTEAQLVKSTPVVSGAAGLLHEPGNTNKLSDDVTVTVPANTQILSIAFKGSTSARAQQGAAAFAQAYLDNRAKDATDALNLQVQAAQHQLDILVNQLRDVTGQVVTLPASSPTHAFAVSQQGFLGQQTGTLNTQLSQLRGTPITPGQVVSAPTVPTSPSSPVWPLNLASGAVLGALLGALFVFLGARPRQNRRIRRADDLAGLFDGPVVIAPAQSGSKKKGSGSSGRTGYQRMANAMLFAPSHQPSLVVVTGVSEGSSGAYAALGLAEALARSGQRVALVDADLEFGTLTTLMSAARKPGLSEVLLDGVPVEEVAHATEEPGFSLVPIGGRGPEATRLAQVPRIRAILAALQRTVDVVLVAAPSAAESSDAQLLARLADGVVVAVEAGRGRQVQVDEAAAQMRAVGAPVLGGILLAAGRQAGVSTHLRGSHPPGPITHPGTPALPRGTSRESVKADLLGAAHEPDEGEDDVRRTAPAAGGPDGRE